jgi:GT2 family glycosyltransferase
MITTVVISWNRRDDLLASLPRHPGPVILVDNGSTDGTVAAVRAQLPHIEVIELGRNIGAPARNVGVQAARTPYVAFADDDSWWAPGAPDRAVALFEAHPRVGLLAARMLVGPAGTLDPLSAELASAPLGTTPGGAGPDVLGFAACAAAVRRSAFLAAGGFDPVVRFPGEEERLTLDLASAGWLLSYADELVVHHHPSPSRGPAVGRQRLIARNALLTAVMRRPWAEVRDRAVTGLRGPGRAGVLHAVPRLPAALWRRRPVPVWLESRVRALAAGPAALVPRPAPSAVVPPVPRPADGSTTRV